MNQGWPMVPLGELLKPVSREESVAPDRQYDILGAHWYAKGLYTKETKYGSEIAASKVYRVEEGDFVYSRLFAWKGSFALATAEHHGCYVSNEFPCFAVNRGRLDPRFILHYFSRGAAWTEALGLSSSSTPTSRNRLKEAMFLRMSIPLPPLPEQRRIVMKIERLVQRIKQSLLLRNSSNAATAALMHAGVAAVTKGMDVTGLLRDVLLGKPRNGWSARCDNVEGGIPVLALTAVTGFVYQRGAFKRTSLPTSPDAHYWLKPGDLLMTRSNTPDLVGHAAIYDGEPSPCIYPDLMMRLEVNPGRADVRFVWRWLQTPMVRDYITANAKGTSPTMKKIGQRTVMSIPFPSALSLTEQGRIVAYLDDLQAKADSLKALQAQSAAEIDALFPSILDRAFKGQL